MNVLVYDNQLAYYELLKFNFSDSCNFELFSLENSDANGVLYDVIVFFLYDELELLDFIKLYNKDIPVIFGISPKDKEEEIAIEDNIYYLHLDKLKDEIINELGLLLEKMTV